MVIFKKWIEIFVTNRQLTVYEYIEYIMYVISVELYYISKLRDISKREETQEYSNYKYQGQNSPVFKSMSGYVVQRLQQQLLGLKRFQQTLTIGVCQLKSLVSQKISILVQYGQNPSWSWAIDNPCGIACTSSTAITIKPIKRRCNNANNDK